MARKFGRNYRLTIYPIDGGDPIIITLPFTISFTCNRNINASINELDIDIYNLGLANRLRIFQDINVIGAYTNIPYNADGQDTRFFNFLLEAGYGNTLYRVFYGKMMQASSAREGTNIITRIRATSNLLDLAGTQIQLTLQAGQSVSAVLNTLIQQFPNLKLGAMGSHPDVLYSPVVLNGNVWEALKTYSDGTVYEDNGKIYILRNQEVLNKVTQINDATGLLQTPRRQLGTLQVTTLMETSIDQLGQQVDLFTAFQPEFNSIYNGNYKVNGITHQGIISGAVSGNFQSIFTLQSSLPYKGFTVVNS